MSYQSRVARHSEAGPAGPSKITLDDNYEHAMSTYEQAVDRGEAELINMGFPPAARPMIEDGKLDDRPSLPATISNLSMSQLQDLLSYFTAWHSYAIEHLPRAVSQRNAAENARDFAWASIRRHARGTVSDKDNQTRTDTRYIEANALYETCDFKARKIKAICDGLMREIDTLSRAITALEQRRNSEGRQVVGEHRGDQVNAGPSFRNSVLNQFRKGSPR